MAFRLHSRLVFFNVCAIAIVTLFMGVYLSSNLRSTIETDIEDQLYATATLAKGYMRESPLRGKPIEMADDISSALGIRVTLVAPDGKVLGDSDLTPKGVAEVENHAGRPEIIAAMEGGRGTSIRSSATVGVPFIY